jgi:hypothetical protein
MDGVYMSAKDQRIYLLCQDFLLGRLTIKDYPIRSKKVQGDK